MSKKHIFSLIVLVALSGCSVQKEQEFRIPEKETTAIGSGEVSQSNTYIGYIEAVESSSVGAKIGGRITEISVQKGDRVKAGQIIAKLDGSEAKESFSSAGDILASTQNVLANTSTLFDAQIASMKEKVSQAKQNIALVQSSLDGTTTGLQDTKNTTDESLRAAERQVEQSVLAEETAQTQYENTKNLLDQKEQDIYLNALNTLHSADVLATNLLDFTDTLYGASDANRHANDAFETYFGGRNPTLRPKGESLWLQNKTLYTAWKAKIDALGSVDSHTEEWKKQIYSTLKESQSFFEGLRDFADFTYSCLEASIATSNFTDATITAYKTQVSAFRSNIESSLLSVNGNYIVGIKGSIQNIDNIGNESKLQLSLLSKQIELAKKAHEVASANYNQAKSGATGKINEVSTKTNMAENQLQIAKTQYNEAVAGLAALERQKDMQLSTINAQISSIRGNKDLAGITVSNATLVAPFDGVVMEKMASVGQVVGSGLPIFQIAKDDQVKIKILVGESEVKNLSVWDSARITVAGGDSAFTGSIHTIQPFSDTLSKKVPVEIWMPNTDHAFLLGSYVSAAFSNTPIAGKTIGYRFVEYSYGKSVINVVRDGRTQKIEISLRGCSESLCAFDGDVQAGETVELP